MQEQELRASNLSEMIAFCLERDLRPVLVIPPIHPELREYFTDSFVKHYINDFLKREIYSLHTLEIICLTIVLIQIITFLIHYS